jgi:hypothetical protein
LVEHRTYFPQYHVSLWQIIATYYVASILCGVALAYLYFLFDRRWTAVLMGSFLGFLFYGSVGVAMAGFHVLAIALALGPAIVVGGGVALTLYDDEHQHDLPAA